MEGMMGVVLKMARLKGDNKASPNGGANKGRCDADIVIFPGIRIE